MGILSVIIALITLIQRCGACKETEVQQN